MNDLTDSFTDRVEMFQSKEIWMQGKMTLVVGGSSMYLPKRKRVHMMSVSLGSFS